MRPLLVLSHAAILYLFVIHSVKSQNVIFETGFNNTLLSSEGESPDTAFNISFANGFSDFGIQADTGDILKYNISNNINAEQGSMTVWIKPNWQPGGTLYRILVVESSPVFEMHVDESASVVFAMFSDQIESRVVLENVNTWNKGEWHFLGFNWDQNKIEIFIDGIKTRELAVGYEIPAFGTGTIQVGSLNGEDPFNGIIDELTIYDAPMTSLMMNDKYQGGINSIFPGNALTVNDIFGRNVTEGGLTLVDWEGPVRNPAMKYYLKGSNELTFPLTVGLTTMIENTSFSLPSTISSTGPSKTVILDSFEDIDSFLFSFYMDEDFDNESFDLSLSYNLEGFLRQQKIPVTVIDQDYDRALSYPVVVDFSETVHPLMTALETQEIIKQAAEDWLYYIDGENVDEIPIGGSSISIGGQDHFFEEKTATNPISYKGYYLYAFGNSNSGPCVCSTGAPNRLLLQSSNSVQVPIFRIGALHLNVLGQAFETEPTGWEILSPYDNWILQGLIVTDIYTLAKHEIGHAMVFENSPLFLLAQGRDPSNPFPDESIIPNPNGFSSPALTAYYPDEVVPLFPTSLSHLYQVLDPASQSIPYGGGVSQEIMPLGREMLTKLDILIMESVGYPLRDNEVTKPLSLDTDDLLSGNLDMNFEAKIKGNGGIPVYDYSIIIGNLPNGLSLDRRTGKISGVPDETGEFPITIEVKDYDERSKGATFDAIIRIGDSNNQLCNESVNVNGTIVDGTYHFNAVLSSSGLIENERQIIFKSASSIEFNIDFSVKLGGFLEAYIENCN